MFSPEDCITIAAGIHEWFEAKRYICTWNGGSRVGGNGFGVFGRVGLAIFHHAFHVVAGPQNVAVYLDHVNTPACLLLEVEYANPRMLEILEEQILVYVKALKTTTPAG